MFISVFTGNIHISHHLVGVTYYILDATALAVPFLKAEKTDGGSNAFFVFLGGEVGKRKKE